MWYTWDSVGKLDIAPFEVSIKNPEIPGRIKQYPMSQEGRQGLQPEIERLIARGSLEPCMSPFNTPVLPVKKPDGSSRLVHDFREINKRMITRFPVVANPWTLLSQLTPALKWYTAIDLKDAFWETTIKVDSATPGIHESPNLFGQALEQVLGTYQPDPQVTLVQHVDDLLLAGADEGQSEKKV